MTSNREYFQTKATFISKTWHENMDRLGNFSLEKV